MKHSFLKIISLMASTLSLSSCVLFNVKYTPYNPEGKTEVEHEYSISEKEITINVGESVKLKGLIDGNEPPFNLPWKSNDNYVATISSNGTVKGIGGGMCLITVTFTKEHKAYCKVNVVGERKLPKAGALAKFFVKNGVVVPASFQGTFLYNKYVISGETTINGQRCEYEYLYFDDHGAETPFKISMNKYDDNNVKYSHEYRFQEKKFFEGLGFIIVYGNESILINDSALLTNDYYARDNNHITLADGKTVPHGDYTSKPASSEQMLEAFYLLNDCIDYLYEIMDSKGSLIKLF